MAPTTRMAVLLGMALGGLLGTSLKAAVIVGVCNLAFGVRYDLGQWPLAVLVFLAAMAGVYAVGMILASLYLFFTREAYHLNQLLQEPVYLLTGFYFPVRSLGMGVAVAASVLPITLGLDGMRQLLFPPARATALLPVETELVLLVVLFGVFFLLSRFALRYMERLGKRDGRVTLKGQ